MCPPATAELLQRLAQSSAPGLRLEADDLGVAIELADPALRFHHSFVSGTIAQRARLREMMLDALHMQWRELRLRPDPDCPVCGP